MARTDARVAARDVANAGPRRAFFLRSRRGVALHRACARHQSRRPACASSPAGRCCVATASQLTARAGVDRARRRRAPHHHPAAGRRSGASCRHDRRRRDRRGRARRAARPRIRRSILPSCASCAPSIAPLAQMPAAAHSHRMGAADLGHHRRAEDGRAHLAALTGAIGTEPGRRRRRLGHVLRHSPLRRAADLPARGLGGASLVLSERRRAGRRSSGAARRATASRICPARRRTGGAR